MSLLHVIRPGGAARAIPVISRQLAQGVALSVVLVNHAEAPGISAPLCAVGDVTPPGVEQVSWGDVVARVFAADTVVTW